MNRYGNRNRDDHERGDHPNRSGYGSRYPEYNRNSRMSDDDYGSSAYGRWNRSPSSSGQGYFDDHEGERQWYSGGTGYDDDRAFSGYGGSSRYDYKDDRRDRSNMYDRGEQGGRQRDWWDKTSDEVSSWFGDDEAERRRRMDRHGEGEQRGRGPRNYTRSDDRIKEDINDRLTDHSYLDASDIEVEVTGGDVVLTGTVENRWSKRKAEDLAESCSGVKNVENRLRVKKHQNDMAIENNINRRSATA